MKLKRSSGILVHPTSLPGEYGIGSLGRSAYELIDFLAASGQSFWQILPLGPTGYGDSPYQSFSSHAGNPVLIDIPWLIERNLISSFLPPSFPEETVDYAQVIPFKERVLRDAFQAFQAGNHSLLYQEFEDFRANESHWLSDYSLFMALKKTFDLVSWTFWPDELKFRQAEAIAQYRQQLSGEILYQEFLQFIFFKQWLEIKAYANGQGIQIIGDIPIYVSSDSVEAWTKPEIFQVNERLEPLFVSGVPPDYFSETGQLWGNPVYNWDYLQSTQFQWWKERIEASMKLYDVIRIDHFRGFAEYWAVPAGEETAMNGEWLDCPGKELFDELKNHFGTLPFIAEDLGLITDSVVELRERYGFPGMKILQFAFDSDEKNNYLPHTYEENFVVYTGTHDNNTVRGWFDAASSENRDALLNYIGYPAEDVSWSLMRMAHASVAALSIFPIQDVLSLGESARMNVPGTTSGNWDWRYRSEALTTALSDRLKQLTKTYDR